MELLLTKHPWVLDAAVVALCATLLATSASGMVDARLATMVARKPRPARARAVPPQITQGKQPDAIVRRNIFCSTCPPIAAGQEPQPTSQPAGPSEPQPTALPLKLTAVMLAEAPSEQEWTMAVIRDNEHKTVGAFGLGARIHGATLTAVLATRVYIDNAGTTEYLDLFALPPGPRGPARPAPPPPPLAKPGDALSRELDRGIKKLGERRYEVQRGTLDAVLGNMSLLARSARIVPEMRNGKSVGFRLFKVKPDGAFAKIGLQNGDVISSINGLEITSPEKALEVYAKLKSASHLNLGLERNGKKTSADYTIR
jgi:general secretion pathway protein C